MGIEATFITTCDGCDIQVRHTVTLETGPRMLDWGNGWPDGWSQWGREPIPDPDHPGEEISLPPLFFHDDSCLKAWLIRNGQADVAADMDNWIAIA